MNWMGRGMGSSQLGEGGLAHHQASYTIPKLFLFLACLTSTWEYDLGKLQVPRQLGYTVRPCLKKKHKKGWRIKLESHLPCGYCSMPANTPSSLCYQGGLALVR
jgi:hypothetical protein